MNQRDLVVKIAQGEVGNVGGEKYWRWYGFDFHVQWCASFVSWVLAKAGVQCGDLRPYINKTDTSEEVAAIESFVTGDYDALISKGCMQMHTFYENKGMRIGDIPAMPGDIVLYEWDPNGPGAEDGVDHVGIVEWAEGEDPNTQILHLIEGNWGDQVCRTTYAYRDARVLAICRPNYRNIPEQAPEETVVNVTLRQLQEGDSGLDVGVVQQLLVLHGYDPAYVDCIFGKKTRAAVLKFQWGMNLEADGIVGEKTWTALLGG